MAVKATIKKNGFDSLSEEMLNQGATYFSLILLDEKKEMVYYKSTNNKWHEKYVINEYYKHCHLIKRTNDLIRTTQAPFTLPWDFVKCDGEIANEINALRIENRIAHGVSFCNHDFHHNNEKTTFIITLAGRECDVNFSENVIKHKKIIMESVVNSGLIKRNLIK